MFSLLVAGACCLSSESNAALVLIVDGSNELLSFRGTTTGLDEEVSPEFNPGFSVIEWGTSSESSAIFDLKHHLAVDAPTVMNFINFGNDSITISFQFDTHAIRSFVGLRSILDYSAASPKSKIYLAALAGSSLNLIYGNSSLEPMTVVAGDLSTIPEPSSAILLLLGSGLCFRRWR